MECIMPNKEYERTMNHTYLILEKYSYFGEEEKKDFRKRMILDNQIPGLLPISCKEGKEGCRYYYEINSLEAMDKLYEEAEISYEQLQKLFLGVIRLFQNLEEYLLEGVQVIMRPEYIYLDPEKMEPYFICFPDYEGNVRQEFVELVDYILAKIDHTDERAVMLGYQVYRYTRNPNYVLSEIHQMLRLVGEAEEVTVPENRRYTPQDEVTLKEPELENEQISYGEEIAFEEKTDERTQSKRVRSGMMATIIMCLLLVEEYMLGLFSLKGKQMIYVCGMAALCAMATGIMLYAEKKQKKCNEKESLEEMMLLMDSSAPYESETTYLTKDVAEEYFPAKKHSLVGVVHGEEIKYSLQRFPLTIGKQEGGADLIIPDSTVSRQHARLEQIEGKIYIRDVNSTNGTIKNGKLLGREELALLEEGDCIVLGNASFTFC